MVRSVLVETGGGRFARRDGAISKRLQERERDYWLSKVTRIIGQSNVRDGFFEGLNCLPNDGRLFGVSMIGEYRM